MQVRLTHIGGPTVLIEFGGWRLLTDPTFDPAGGKYRFGWGTGSTKLTGPSISPEALGDVDAVLLSHDHHDDNLDAAGRALLPRAGTVITTEAGARRLGGNAQGLAPWGTTALRAEGKPPIEVTATPCRHGPPLSKPLVGNVVGFALRWEGQEHGALWISGDTVLYDGVREVADRVDVGTALVHLGGVRFPTTGPLRYTLGAGEAVELLDLLRPPDDGADPLRGLAPLPPGPRRAGGGAGRSAGRGPRPGPLAADRQHLRARGLSTRRRGVMLAEQIENLFQPRERVDGRERRNGADRLHPGRVARAATER